MKRIVLGFVLMVNYSVFAQTIITDRPDQTESSSTIKKGSLQIESGILVGFYDDGIISERKLLAPTTLFRLGLSKMIELRVLNQFESVNKFSGISDIELGTKIQLFKKENSKTEVAFLSHLIIPTGSKEISNNEYGTINKLSIAHDLIDGVAIGYNVGYNNFGAGNGDFTYSLAIGFELTDELSVYIEPYGDIVEFNKYVTNMDVGFAYLVKDNFQFDFSFGVGINHSMNYLSTGISLNIGSE